MADRARNEEVPLSLIIRSLTRTIDSRCKGDAMELIDAFAYRVRTTGPLKTTKGSPAGERSYWIVSEAQLDGPQHQGEARRTWQRLDVGP